MTWAMQRKKKEFCSLFVFFGGGLQMFKYIYIERKYSFTKMGLEQLRSQRSFEEI